MGEDSSDIQPRQPKDLEGLLKFCMQATLKEDAKGDSASTEPLSSERLQWLQEAIKGMSVDVVQELLQALKILSKPCIYDSKASKSELKEAELAFDIILDRIGCIDMGNNFHKIGGPDVLKRCIKHSPHSMIKWNASNIIAELSQNNPSCQEQLIKQGFIPLMINLLRRASIEQSSIDEMCCLKAIYAISCMIRQNMFGIALFLSLDGPKDLVKCAILPQNTSIKLLIKTCFFVASICNQNKAAIEAFSEIGLTRHLIMRLTDERNIQAYEYIAKALVCLMKEKSNETEWIALEDDLKSHIESRKHILSEKQECEEELSYYQEIEKIMNERAKSLYQKCITL